MHNLSTNHIPGNHQNEKDGTGARIVSWLLWPMYMVGTLWAFGAIHFNGPMDRSNSVLAWIWLVCVVGVLIFVRRPWKRAISWTSCFALVLVPWLLIRPTNDRDWQPDWKETGWVEINKDAVTFYNLRNFDYDLDGTKTERWQTRTVSLSNLHGVDYFQDNFGGDLWAHPMLSFDFGPDGHITLSIETRREIGESFSQFGGLYKMFELQYIFGDEADLVRVRTNIRGEPVYLYRSTLSPKQAKQLFLDSVAAHNGIFENPRFYNVISANCTTSLRAQTAAEDRNPLDKRLLFNGRLDELLYERDTLVTDDLPFPDLRAKALINDVALSAHKDQNFSKRIREGRPGF